MSFRIDTPFAKAEFDMVFEQIDKKLSRLSMKENMIRDSFASKLFLAIIIPIHTRYLVKKMLKVYKEEIESVKISSS